MKTKTCRRCGCEKDLTEFYSWVAKKTGERKHQAWCKVCVKSYLQNKHGLRPRAPKVTHLDPDTPWHFKFPNNRDRPWKQGYKCGFCCDRNCRRCPGGPCSCDHRFSSSELIETHS